MDAVGEPVLAPDERWNDSAAALGRMSRSQLCGIKCIWSPDAGVYCVPTLLTAIIVAGTLYVLWDELAISELCVLALLLSVGFISGFLVISTDPGIYPRMRPGETDPLHDEKDFVYCRVCCLRRPPRVSHCYQCNVCVREHDHHCGILGGCVGQRSLRWFTLYLVTIAMATGMGLFWVFRSLLSGNFVPQPAVRGMAKRETKGVRFPPSDQDGAIKAIAVVVLLVVLALVVVLVGTLGVLYVYLSLTSTTRRESQKNSAKFFVFLRPKMVWENIKHVVRPIPSALTSQDPDKLYPVLV